MRVVVARLLSSTSNMLSAGRLLHTYQAPESPGGGAGIQGTIHSMSENMASRTATGTVSSVALRMNFSAV